jgi:cardiolipin synthase
MMKYSVHNKIELVKGGADYFNKLTDLFKNAKTSIYIRIYIWEDDHTGTTIANNLISAAERGVAVFVIADGYASQGLSNQFIKRLRDSGIYFKFFEPLIKSSHFYFGRRMHEKIVVIDGSQALIGGINFADRYNEANGIPAWLDYALLVEGEAAVDIYNYCLANWSNMPKRPPQPANFLAEEYCTSVKVVRNDWVKRKHEIWKTYFNWFNQAEQSITIMCSYFLPGRTLRKALSAAAKAGVKVKLILAGRSDVMLAKYAERYLYRWMLKNNIDIYEYQPTILHAKMMVVDEHWVTVGSYNVNNVSAYASAELNLNIRNKPFARSVQTIMNKIMETGCIRIHRNYITGTSTLKRLLQKVAYELVRVALNLSTFYFKHE